MCAQSRAKKIELVKFDNRFNNLHLTHLNSQEINVLCTSLALVADQGTTEITVSFDEFADMAGIANPYPGYMDALVTDTADKVFNLKIQYLDARIKFRENLHLFRKMRTDGQARRITLLIEEEVVWLVNGLKNNFTAFELSEIVKLSGKTAKRLFLHLKQWKSVGEYSISVQDCRTILGVPNSCPDCNILTKYIRPAVEEIVDAKKSFAGLTVSPVKIGRAHKLVGFEFRWTPEKTILKNPAHDMIEHKVVEIRDKVLHRLGEEKLYISEYESLADCYGTELVDSVISRILVHEYYGKLNVATIRAWCEERMEEINQTVNEAYFPEDPEVNDAFIAYLNMRKQSGSPLCDVSIKGAKTQLERYSLGDHERALKILQKSISSGWRGLYPLQEAEEVGQADYLSKWANA